MAILDHVYNWFFELATNKYGYVVVNKVLEKFYFDKLDFESYRKSPYNFIIRLDEYTCDLCMNHYGQKVVVKVLENIEYEEFQTYNIVYKIVNNFEQIASSDNGNFVAQALIKYSLLSSEQFSQLV